LKTKLSVLLVAVLSILLISGAVLAGRGPGSGNGGQCPYGYQGRGCCPGGGGGRGGQCPYNGTKIDGKITGVDSTNKTIAVDTGNGIITVVVTDKTVIKIGPDETTFGKLEVGQTVRACGELKEKTLTAWVVTVRYRGK